MTVAENKQNIVRRPKNFFTLGSRCSCSFLLGLLRLERLKEIASILDMIGIVKPNSSVEPFEPRVEPTVAPIGLLSLFAPRVVPRGLSHTSSIIDIIQSTV